MLTPIDDLPPGVVGITASGQVSGDDYREVLIPAVEAALGKRDRVRLLYHIGPDFKRFTTTALWEDARVGLHHLGAFERVAVVTDVDWLARLAAAADAALPCRVRAFADAELGAARAWLVD